MDTQLYLRVRGRVLGPYDQEKLQSLVRRGQLGRMHEVSTDGTNWVQASSYPELFVGAPAKMPAPEPSDSAPSQGQQAAAHMEIPLAGESSAAALARPKAASSPGRLWYYEHAGMENGPVQESVLRQLLLKGQMDPELLVWNETMPQWVAASQIPGLISTPAMNRAVRGADDGSACVGRGDEESFQGGCGLAPWVLFLAITAFVHAGLWILLGFLVLVQGAGKGNPFWVATGLVWMISGMVTATGGILLTSYANRLSSLAYGKECKVLETAMERLKTFWIFVSIVTIVILAFAVFLIVWIFAVGVSLARYM